MTQYQTPLSLHIYHCSSTYTTVTPHTPLSSTCITVPPHASLSIHISHCHSTYITVNPHTPLSSKYTTVPPHTPLSIYIHNCPSSYTTIHPHKPLPPTYITVHPHTPLSSTYTTVPPHTPLFLLGRSILLQYLYHQLCLITSHSQSYPSKRDLLMQKIFIETVHCVTDKNQINNKR